MIAETFGYFVIGFGILSVLYIIVGAIGQRKDYIKRYGKDFWDQTG